MLFTAPSFCISCKKIVNFKHMAKLKSPTTNSEVRGSGEPTILPLKIQIPHVLVMRIFLILKCTLWVH